MMLKKVLMIVTLVLFLSSTSVANCKVKHELMYAIASVEKHPKLDVGYPYIISFNNKEDWIKKDEVLKGSKFRTFKNDNRTIDCLTENNCVSIAKKLINKKIVNMDMGAFQICYRWHKYSINTYFDLIKSYNKACSLVMSHVKRKGNTWEAIASYHSQTKKFNERYSHLIQKKLIQQYPYLMD